MRHLRSRMGGFDIQVDAAGLVAVPDTIPEPATVPGPRLVVIGRRSVRCRDCRDFQTVMTRRGPVACSCVSDEVPVGRWSA